MGSAASRERLKGSIMNWRHELWRRVLLWIMIQMILRSPGMSDLVESLN